MQELVYIRITGPNSFGYGGGEIVAVSKEQADHFIAKEAGEMFVPEKSAKKKEEQKQ